MRTMKEVVTEYNELTGENVKRFATVEVGEKRIAQFKARVPAKPAATKPAATKHAATKPAATKPATNEGNFKMRITVDAVPYRSVKIAFEALGLPLGRHIKFRADLHKEGRKVFEHEGKQLVFTLIKQE